MAKKLFIALLVASALQTSCGGLEAPELGLETADPDFLPGTPAAWPDAPDLGVVVSSGLTPSDNRPPPPDFIR